MKLKIKKLSIAVVIFLSLSLIINPAVAFSTPNPPQHETDIDAQSYPPDPTSDITWAGGTNGVADIQYAFNYARNQENSQLGISLPAMVLPTQTIWDGMTDNEKSLWLINQERVVRGVAPLENIEDNVISVAQYYADYLFDNDKWGHYEDGNSPWERLENNPAIGACHDFLGVSENIAAFMTSGSSIALPIERSIFTWLYKDAGSSWGHRHAILWYPYNDNSGLSGHEGFLGIGRANGDSYQAWNFSELIVMNVFDPCSSWVYPAPEVVSITRADHDPTGADIVNFTITFSEVVSGVDLSDFSLTIAGGVSGAALVTVSNNPNTIYNLSVNTGTGEGTIRLDLKSSNTNIINSTGTPMNGGFISEEFYTTLTPPSNDDFDSPININTVPDSKSMNTEGATSDADDPEVSDCNLGTGEATVWYEYTHTGTNPAISFDTKPASYDTFIAVWTGTRTDLTLIACNDDTNGTIQSSVAFLAIENETYYIEIGQP